MLAQTLDKIFGECLNAADEMRHGVALAHRVFFRLQRLFMTMSDEDGLDVGALQAQTMDRPHLVQTFVIVVKLRLLVLRSAHWPYRVGDSGESAVGRCREDKQFW